MVRAFYYSLHRELVTVHPPTEHGMIRPRVAPGHGLTLPPEVLARKDCHTRRSLENSRKSP